ncbi:AraC family transcriptional regulator [Amphritea balenae]|uniref:AraC family transcriptional regulator n=1 Tax=Amphritea balenae TaxID=452629 RepID=A0A3P1SQG6_9GAMM|nr:helix-turn-helix transcriptional regulator [Amphritea balenae]RRC99377.1 AraC family transcriptional regulator [Amphritea balenae]GGK71649.1 AraC family transcriptional regulator [Amphritea balenae]
MNRLSSTELSLLEMASLPRELFVRQEVMPSRHFFPPHQHDWHQLLYAVSGVLVVDLTGERYFIPPEQVIWLPRGCQHSVYTEYGADLKSLYVKAEYKGLSTDTACVLHITPLIRELILSAADFEINYSLQGYENDLVQLLLQSLARLEQSDRYLPWPVAEELAAMCSRLYLQPDNNQTTEQLAELLATTPRTLDRRFRRETGMSLKQWRQQLRLMQAIELLSTGQSITTIALELGYSSASPFIHMFREQFGISPAQYRKQKQH